MKHIFILGGSKLQLDLIYEAKKMYFIVHLFDANNECIGKKYVDYFYHIDIKDKESILQKAQESNPEAVLTIATEVGNVTACYVSEKLGLNSNSYQTSLNTSNKKLMKKLCVKNKIQTAGYKIVETYEELYDWNTFPSIVKPVDSSAGRGVSYVLTKKELETSISKALSFSYCEEVAIEEYIPGKQYSIETISSGGIHKIVAITEEYITEVPIIIETQQLIPARIDNEKKKKFETFAFEVLKAFDIQYGACHIEIREDNDGKLYIVEIASRMGGWRSELINFSLGISYCQILLFSVLDKSIDFKSSRDDTAIVKMILSKDDFDEYLYFLEQYKDNIISDLTLEKVYDSEHLADSNGYYFIHTQDKSLLEIFIGEHC